MVISACFDKKNDYTRDDRTVISIVFVATILAEKIESTAEARRRRESFVFL
jgi:hypothetical protein